MKSVKALVIGFVLGNATCIALLVGKWLLFPTPIQALPFGAQNIKEEYWDSGFLPDFSYKLEADIDPEAFNRFVQKMRFPATSRRNDRHYVIDVPEREYLKSAEYIGGTLHFEERKF